MDFETGFGRHVCDRVARESSIEQMDFETGFGRHVCDRVARESSIEQMDFETGFGRHVCDRVARPERQPVLFFVFVFLFNQFDGSFFLFCADCRINEFAETSPFAVAVSAKTTINNSKASEHVTESLSRGQRQQQRCNCDASLFLTAKLAISYQFKQYRKQMYEKIAKCA